jgi:hypothetical protein
VAGPAAASRWQSGLVYRGTVAFGASARWRCLNGTWCGQHGHMGMGTWVRAGCHVASGGQRAPQRSGRREPWRACCVGTDTVTWRSALSARDLGARWSKMDGRPGRDSTVLGSTINVGLGLIVSFQNPERFSN